MIAKPAAVMVVGNISVPYNDGFLSKVQWELPMQAERQRLTPRVAVTLRATEATDFLSNSCQFRSWLEAEVA